MKSWFNLRIPDVARQPVGVWQQYLWRNIWCPYSEYQNMDPRFASKQRVSQVTFHTFNGSVLNPATPDNKFSTTTTKNPSSWIELEVFSRFFNQVMLPLQFIAHNQLSSFLVQWYLYCATSFANTKITSDT